MQGLQQCGCLRPWQRHQQPQSRIFLRIQHRNRIIPGVSCSFHSEHSTDLCQPIQPVILVCTQAQMVSATSSSLSSAKAEAKALFSQREAIEAELEAAASQLAATGTKLNDSLVDKEARSWPQLSASTHNAQELTACRSESKKMGGVFFGALNVAK